MTFPRRRTPRRARIVALVGLAVTLTVAGGCSGVPGTGPAVDVSQVVGPKDAVSPEAPQPGLPPDQVVREFIGHSTDTSQDSQGGSTQPVGRFQAARQYLSSTVGQSWQKSVNTAVVVLADQYRVLRSTGDGGSVELQGTQIAGLDPDQAYHSQPARAYQRTITLVQQGGEWRIENPPDELLVTASDFNRSYLERTVYFLNSTGTVLVPDPRYLAARVPTVAGAEASRAVRLVDMLLGGPSAALRGAATSQLSKTALKSNVTVDQNGHVVVDLSSTESLTPQARLALGAQLAWTLRQDWEGVVITVNGDPLDQQTSFYTAATTAAFDPDRVPAKGSAAALDTYYVDPAGRIVSLDGDQSIWGREGRSGGIDAAAISAANGTLAVVADTAKGQELRIGRPLDFLPTQSVLTAATITAPSFDRAGNEVWVVQDGATKPQVIRLTTAGPTGREVVLAPELADKGGVSTLVLSPDGVRVALVADGSLYMGVIVTSQESPSGGRATTSISGLARISADLTDIGAVAFSTSSDLLVAGRSGSSAAFRLVYQVSIDGRERVAATKEGISNDVTAVAVNNTATLVAFQGRVWKLDGTFSAGQWISPDPSGQLVAGSAPFVPN